MAHGGTSPVVGSWWKSGWFRGMNARPPEALYWMDHWWIDMARIKDDEEVAEGHLDYTFLPNRLHHTVT
jgi:hypothetical protein